jgi:hypothetical protein
MPSETPENRRAQRLRRKARNPEKYLATRREQKRRARVRKALANPKPPRTHCNNGHPEDRNKQGVCRACLRAAKKRQRERLRAAKPPAPPRVPALTQAQKRAADPEGYRAKERENEAKRLGKPVRTLEQYLKDHACTKTPEELLKERKAAQRRSRDKKRGKGPRMPRTKAEKNAAKRRARLVRNGWTPEMYDATFAEQGGRCMICRKAQPLRKTGNGRTDVLCADHNHTTGEPRALLCDKCNTALGLFLDNPETCRAAAEYLEAWA